MVDKLFCDRPLTKWNAPLWREEHLLIAGPCSVDGYDELMATVDAFQKTDVELSFFRGGIWKPRTRPGGFEGLGEEALPWLKEAGDRLGVPAITEVATPAHVEACLKAGFRAFWIGARTTPNPFAVQAIADALAGMDVPVFVKNPISPDVALWAGALERFRNAGITRLAAIHRGFSSSREAVYRNSPLWRIPIELRRRLPGLPLICDPSHMCGRRDLLLTASQQSLDLLFDGFMIETHHAPDEARCDSKQQVTPEALVELLAKLLWKIPGMPAGDLSHHVEELRQQIDTIDEKIIELLAARLETATAIGEYKKQAHVAPLQPSRFEATLQVWVEHAEKLGLEPSYVAELLERIHEESLRSQA